MQYFYSLPSIVRLLLIVLILLTIVLNIITILVNTRGKLIKLEPFYFLGSIGFVAYLLIHLGIVASVQRHMTENMISYDYYFVLRCFTAAPIALALMDIVMNKRLRVIPNVVLMLVLFPTFEAVFKQAYPYIYVVATIYFFIEGLYELITRLEKVNKEITAFSIKEALDKLPMGIIFGDQKGKIIFINQKCNDILIANSIDSKIKINTLWEEIKTRDTVFKKSDNTALLKLDNIAYMLVLEEITNDNKTTYQIKATDVTEEIEMLTEIENANKQLEAQETEMRENIYKLNEIESQRSLVKIKGRIHDVFAQRLSIIHQYLDNEEIKDVSITELKKLINDMAKDIKEEKPLSKEEMKQSLISSYELIGMKIIFNGDIRDTAADSVLKTIREAATNALRHGGATELYIKVLDNTIEITNNGSEPTSKREGNGLKNMRFVASEAKLDIEFNYNPFTIVIKY